MADLEKRFTEFQLAESEDRILLGAIGLHIDQQQARLHSEAYTSEEVEEVCRLQLWQQVQSVVRNHGLFRVWTQAEEAFWPQNGFSQAEGQVLEKLPASFGDHGRWFTCSFGKKAAAISLDGEFELFTQAQKGHGQAMQQARVLKTLAYVLVLIFLLGVIAAGSTSSSILLCRLSVNLEQMRRHGRNCAPPVRWPHGQIPFLHQRRGTDRIGREE